MHPTPYPDVNALLHALQAGAHTVLQNRLIGVYLYGSLALGDFDLESSDIDFGHQRWAAALEGSYIPVGALRRYNPADARHLHVYEGHLGIEQHGVHWVIERHVLREHGLVLQGPAPETLIDPVAPGDLRRAVVELMHAWWAPMVDHPARLYDKKYQRYAVETMCRVLVTLRHGTVVAKPAAVRFAREALDLHWRALLDQSQEGSSDEGAVSKTRTLIRHTLQQCKTTGGPDGT